MTDFDALLATLAEHEVAFILVGGAAAIAHGSARLTQDLDIVYQRNAGNLDRLVEALAHHKPYLRGAPPGLPFSLEPRYADSRTEFHLDHAVRRHLLEGRDSGRGHL
jgi:hypothetical protein